MASMKIQRMQTDVLVVGAGGAGCFAALTAADGGAKVLILNKVPWLGGCTMMARALFAAATGDADKRDNPDIHFHDSIRGGDYMGNQKVMQAACHKAVAATRTLLGWGATFRKDDQGRLFQGSKPTAGHTYPRDVLVAGDFSHIGKAIMDPLQRQIRQRGIAVVGNVMVTRLITSRGEVTGAVGYDWRSGSLVVVSAKAVVIATGGTGRLYKYTDNPTYMTGDGYAVMARAGAELVDMEFCDFQLAAFYPPQIFGYPPNGVMWLMKGGILLNRNGERFYRKYFPNRADEGQCLRTELNKAAAWEILEGRGSPHGMVYLNCGAVPRDWMMSARGDMVSHFKRAGVDLTWQPMEVAPANHTWLGGLRIDEHAASRTLPGLYAAGEAAGGWGGSNRLAGNAVAAALGLGIMAGESAARRNREASLQPVDEAQVGAEAARIAALMARTEGVKAQEVKGKVQTLIQENVWLKRSEEGLKHVLAELAAIGRNDLPALCVPRGKDPIRFLQLREALEAENLVLCGRIVATAALARQESRGSHQRVDYPETDNRQWLRNVVVRQEGEAVEARPEPLVVTEVPLPRT